MRIVEKYEQDVYEIKKLYCGREVSFEGTKVVIQKA